jgi:nucleotide-binding universal stress UspA family protein
MSTLFKNILVPVDFSVNTEVAVEQAVELACLQGSTIHLLHVIRSKTMWSKLYGRSRSAFNSGDNNFYENILIKLQQWAQAIEETLPNSKVNTYVGEGVVPTEIQRAASEIEPQLIIIGKDRYHQHCGWNKPICPNALAKSTGYPVLTVVRRSINKRIKIIVVPVGSFIPVRKIELVIELAKKYRAAIHLVTIPNEIELTETNGNSFLETYRILKSNLSSPIEHHILEGKNLAKAILEYAECIGADLILVNPDSETKISNLTGKHINDVLAMSSKMKILSVEPYHKENETIH